MDIGQSLNTQIDTRVALSHALQQSLEILRLSQAELAMLIHREIETNPLLELDAFPASPPSYSVPEIAAAPSLRDHLLSQIREAFHCPKRRALAEEMLGLLDEKGFMNEPLEAFTSRFNLIDVQCVLQSLQTFDPPGIFSRNLQEAFLIQLRERHNQLAFKLVQQSFEDLIHGRYQAIKKKLRITDAELQRAIQQLARLSTRPASQFHIPHSYPIHPDLHITCTDRQWVVCSAEELLPKFHLKVEYLHIAELKTFATSAKWLLRSISRRRKCLLALGTFLVRKQKPFLSGSGSLIPLNLREVASIFKVHESTISRAIADKYISTPCGLLALRALIPTLNQPTKERLQKLIACEDRRRPLTDNQLAQEMSKSGFHVARRTIAKYRKQLKLASATARKHRG